jgi:hypothetical protein
MMRSMGIPLVMILLSAPLVRGQDLSKYRDFSLGMSLPELSNQVDLRPLQTKLIQKHPAVIQELTCWPGSSSSDYSRQTDSVWQIFFSFYNGELFRILVTYDRDASGRPRSGAAEEPEDFSPVVLVQGHTHKCQRCGVKGEFGEANYQDEYRYPTSTFCTKCWPQEVPRDAPLPEEKD